MNILEIEKINKELKNNVTEIKRILVKHQNGDYLKEPWGSYTINGFKEKDNIHTELYKKVFEAHNLKDCGKQTLDDNNLNKVNSIEFASNCISFLSYFIAINHCTSSTVSLLRHIFNNNFPLLTVLKDEYGFLFEEIIKTNLENYSEFKHLLIECFYTVTDEENLNKSNKKDDFLLQWFALKIDLLSRKDSEMLTAIYDKFNNRGYIEKPPTGNHWIRGLVRQIEFKYELVNKQYVYNTKKDNPLEGKLKKIISIHSRKGGVGKTTFAILLAINLLKKKKGKICIVDFDTHGPALSNILNKYNFSNDNQEKSTITDYLLSDDYQTFNFKNVYTKIRFNNVDENYLTLISMSERAGDIDAINGFYRKEPDRLLSNFEQKINHFFNTITNQFGHIVVDTHPGLWGISREILTLNYNYEGTLVFVASPTIHDLIGYGYEFKQMEDLPGFSDFRLIINKLEKKTYDELFDKTVSLKKLIKEEIKMYPSDLTQEYYENVVEQFLMFIDRKAPNYIQLYNELLHFYDIRLTDDNKKDDNKKKLEEIMKLEEMQKLINEIIEGVT